MATALRYESMNKPTEKELVNLMLVGKASSNVFDGNKDFDGMWLKGIPQQSTIGYLSLFENYNNMEV